MSLFINSGSNTIEIKNVLYNKELNAFNCFDAIDEDPVFQFQLPFVLQELPSSEFTEKVYFFKNHLYPSKKKIQLDFKHSGGSKLVGYIFSIDDLVKSPEIFENIHLQKMAFNVIYKLLSAKDISIIPKVSAYRQDSDYILSDFYDEDSILVAICDQFVDFEGYNFINYMTSFYDYGFRYCPSTGFYPNDIDVKLITENYQLIKNRLKLSSIENGLLANYFIKTLITNEIYLKDNEVARFHLFYQVLEMLMEKVLKFEVQDKACTKLNDLTGYDLKDFFRDVMRDSYTLDKLIGANYTILKDELKNELSQDILSFLAYTKTNIAPDFPSKDISSKIYKIRNILFHGYSKILSDDSLNKINTENLLKKLNDTFECLILCLISSFKK